MCPLLPHYWYTHGTTYERIKNIKRVITKLILKLHINNSTPILIENNLFYNNFI